MIAFLRLHLLRIAKPFLEWFSHVGNQEAKVDGFWYDKMVPLIKDGDCLLSRQDYHPINWLIPGFWCHAAIVGWGEENYVVEAVGEGVRKQSLAQWILQKDHVMILRPKNMSEAERDSASIEAYTLIGLPYDYDLSPNNKAFYCAEIVQYLYAKFSRSQWFTTRETFGIQTTTPQDIANMANIGKFDVIGCFGGPK